jgi:hypothetical protein
MARPGRVRGLPASLLGPVLYLPLHVAQPVRALVIRPCRMVVLISCV